MTALAILLGRLARALLRRRGGGSAAPGRVLLALSPRFLSRAVEQLPLGVVFVSGSNGKSTTTHMLASILRAHGLRVFTNPSGANLPQGIASAMLATVPLSGRLTDDVAVLEVDEAFGPRLAQVLVPRSVLLINIQVDQLNRFYEPTRVAGMLEQFARVASDHLVINADDHLLVELAGRLAGGSAAGAAGAGPGGAARQSAFAVTPELLRSGPEWLVAGDLPARATPASGAGGRAAVVVESLDDRIAELSIHGVTTRVDLPARGLHYAVDAAAAVAMADALLGTRLSAHSVVQGLAGTPAVYGRGEVVRSGDEEIEIITMKNPPSLQVNLDYLDVHPEQVFFAVDEGTPDPSWIYATDLSRLDHVDVLTGTKAWQLATRFAHSDIPVRRIEPALAPALAAFLALPKPSRGRKTMIVNYEQMMLVRKALGYRELEA